MDDKQLSNFETRQSKIEDAISKLTEISSDLNKMIAVHELRITHQEKITDSIELVLEKRRSEFEDKIEKINELSKQQEESLLATIGKVKDEVAEVKKQIWLYMGGFFVIIFVLSNLTDLSTLLKHLNH